MLDPSYSVLLGNKDDCSDFLDKSNKNEYLAVIIAVPVVVGLVIVGAVATVVLLPKLRLWKQLRKAKIQGNELDRMKFDRIESVEVNSS